MTTICDLSVPAEEFGLAETLQTVSDAQVTCEPVAASPTESMPLIRAHAPARQELEAAFTSDASVATWTFVLDGGSEWLYRMEWATRVSLVHRLLAGERAMVLSTTGSGRGWTLRVLYPSREICSQIHSVCEEHNLGVTVDAIRDVDSEQSPSHGLTDAQHTALVQAHRMGYFAVPREVDLVTVAETLDLSHQAVSERLRRAHHTLIEITLGQRGAVRPRQTLLTTRR